MKNENLERPQRSGLVGMRNLDEIKIHIKNNLHRGTIDGRKIARLGTHEFCPSIFYSRITRLAMPIPVPMHMLMTPTS